MVAVPVSATHDVVVRQLTPVSASAPLIAAMVQASGVAGRVELITLPALSTAAHSDALGQEMLVSCACAPLLVTVSSTCVIVHRRPGARGQAGREGLPVHRLIGG